VCKDGITNALSPDLKKGILTPEYTRHPDAIPEVCVFALAN